MLVFARFVLRDNGLPIHIATEHVTQIRVTIDGEPAIYILNKETPIIVEGSLEAVVRKLETAASGLRSVEPEPAANVVALEPIRDFAPAPEPVISIVPTPMPARQKKVAKASGAKKPAAKTAATVTTIKRKAKAVAPPPAEDQDSDLSWFKGLS